MAAAEEGAGVNPIVEAGLAIAALGGALGLLVLADWLAGMFRRAPAPPVPDAAPAVREVPLVPVQPGPERAPYGTSGVFTRSGGGGDAA